MPNEIKQVIVIRTDTDPPMRKGKMAAQAAHAAMAFLFSRMRYAAPDCYKVDLTKEEQTWKETTFAKICVRADSLAELLEIHQKARQAGLESHLITDSGLTEFKQPTVTCCAIGPDRADKIDPITRHLKLL